MFVHCLITSARMSAACWQNSGRPPPAAARRGEWAAVSSAGGRVMEHEAIRVAPGGGVLARQAGAREQGPRLRECEVRVGPAEAVVEGRLDLRLPPT